MASLQLPNCKKKSAAHKNGFEVLVYLVPHSHRILYPMIIYVLSQDIHPILAYICTKEIRCIFFLFLHIYWSFKHIYNICIYASPHLSMTQAHKKSTPLETFFWNSPSIIRPIILRYNLNWRDTKLQVQENLN